MTNDINVSLEQATFEQIGEELKRRCTAQDTDFVLAWSLPGRKECNEFLSGLPTWMVKLTDEIKRRIDTNLRADGYASLEAYLQERSTAA